MKALLVLCACCIAAPAFAADALTTTCTGATCPIAAATTITPIQDALTKLTEAAKAYESAATKFDQARAALAAAQQAVATLSQTTSAARAEVAAQQAQLANLVSASPAPPVNPPATHTVVLLEIGGTQCPACRALQPAIDAAKAAGVPVTRVDVDVDSSVLTRWKPERLPTLVMLLDGAELTRYGGTAANPNSTPLTGSDMTDWFQRTQKWAQTRP